MAGPSRQTVKMTEVLYAPGPLPEIDAETDRRLREVREAGLRGELTSRPPRPMAIPVPMRPAEKATAAERMQRKGRVHGLAPSERRVLAMIRDAGGCTSRDLDDLLDLAPGTIRSATQALHGAGLIRGEREPGVFGYVWSAVGVAR